ncbi:MAG: DUF3110 domain-containing protein [Trichodesmium sp. St16_bin4-tuft]|nr:DUF3110 domain-containing protein [Trichodesmium sp. St5_bin8]MDE5092008.1 DUF3110 domain-containing protein [Trichodesmium sp. St18_bin3_1_1]MDE5099258.1 DUF3110 domain-containing protein [Trichodesmium sp. St16_bin4-tuft]MDE5105302.1 DUF3110 domain-containing protein [Trichodesmium sp. St19_bin2]MDT9340103.1 DUF3110 domain-containing protein [Trichodesmium erythraeum 21-75]
MRIFVLLFNARTENEGIHTIQMDSSQKVLMFESEDDATRFGVLLEAQAFPTPTVEEFDQEEIIEFCRSVDYDWEIIPSGKLEIPPEHNVEKTNWQEDANQASENTEADLDKIRRQLEGLL